MHRATLLLLLTACGGTSATNAMPRGSAAEAATVAEAAPPPTGSAPSPAPSALGSEPSAPRDHRSDGPPDAGANLPLHHAPRAGERLCVIAIETSGSGEVDVERIFWDAAGRPVRGTKVSVRDGAVRPQTIRTLERDAQGRVLRHVNDSDGDGKPNQSWSFTYDGEGRAVRMRHDRDADGTDDEGADLTWEGKRLAAPPRAKDETNEGLGVYDLGPTFSPLRSAEPFAGRVVERYHKSLRLGPTGFDWTHVFVYDARGWLSRSTYHRDGDPASPPDRTRTFERDGSGKLLAVVRTPDDIVSGDRTVYRYEADGSVVAVSLAGEVERYRVTRRFDGEGRLVFKRTVQDASDTLFDETRYRYLCP